MSARAWSIEYERRARKDLGRLDPTVRRRVLASIERFATDPSAADVRRLSGRAGYRLRVGDWRVLFELDSVRRKIVVDRVLPRGRAYER
ncbi:MAG: type II toxin-antitoxin system RelE/ParE family toxin [Solirubrobacterales bacterium]|nr:type II toxin-antitoxin system RelE/ParE family toxin [Solirubrobacterales bacterium]